jgi:hypothetical protein
MRLPGLLLGALLVCNTAWAGVVDDMKALLTQRKAAEAYQLGRDHPEEMGDPAFDFHFGVAAVDSGHSGEGVLALERYVLNFPDNAYGRLELARAYFVLGEDARAREEFLLVQQAGPPADVRASVDRFLDALRSREAVYSPVTGSFIEAGFGSDSNVNAGVASGTAFRIFGVELPVPPGVVRRGDTFYTVAAGVTGSRPLAPGLVGFAGANIDTRNYLSATEFSQYSTGLNAGLSLIRGKDVWRGSLAYNNLSVQSERYRDVWTLSGEWQHQLDERQSVNAFAQFSDLSYTGANSALDSTFPVLGVGYRRAFISPLQPLLNLSGYVGKEEVASRPDRSRDVYGARITGSVTPAPRWSLLAGATIQQSDYRSPDAFRMLDFARTDEYTAVDLTASYAITRALSLRGAATVSRNSSNDSLFQYKRDTVTLKVRYDFN